MRSWNMMFILAPALAACGSENDQTVSPQMAEPIDDTAQIINTTPGTPGVETGWDLNRDGTFQLGEWDSVSHRWFPDWDKVRDNRLVREEFESGWRTAGLPESGAAFGRLDRDADGAITREELQRKTLWETLDANGDEQLSSKELQALAP